MMLGLAAALLAIVGAQETEWLQLEARPDLEAHMSGTPLSAPYYDCQCSLDMKCMCDKMDDFTDAFLEERAESGEGAAAPASAPSDSDAGSASDSGASSAADSGASSAADTGSGSSVDLESSVGPPTTNETTADKEEKGNETVPEPRTLEKNPDWDKPRPYFIDPKTKLQSSGCGKPACMKVDVFCANRKKSQCQLKGECCQKARKEMKWLRANEDDAYKKQKAKDFEEFQDVMDQENKLWKRITRLNLWRRKGQIREQNEKAMEAKKAEYDAKLAQLNTAIDKRNAEKAKLETWKEGRVSYFASRMGQMDQYQSWLENLKGEIEEDRKAAVTDFKANEQRMDDYLANSEAAFKSREDKIVEEQARLAEATAAVKAAKSEKEMETEKYMADLAAREKDGTGPLPVTPDARDGKMPAGVAKEEKKGAETKA